MSTEEYQGGKRPVYEGLPLLADNQFRETNWRAHKSEKNKRHYIEIHFRMKRRRINYNDKAILLMHIGPVTKGINGSQK